MSIIIGSERFLIRRGIGYAHEAGNTGWNLIEFPPSFMRQLPAPTLGVAHKVTGIEGVTNLADLPIVTT